MADAGMGGIRWEFGPRVAIADEEAALDTTPLLQSESSFRHDRMGGNSSPTLNMDHSDSTPPQPASPTIAELPIINSPSLPAVIPNSGPMLTVLQSFGLSSLYRSINHFLLSTDADHHRAHMSSQASEGAHASPSHILAPILGDMQKLKALTPESLPPYNSNFKIKSHAQLLKERLLPIGTFITNYLDGIPEAKRGLCELRICRYIADEFWPLPVDNFTYIKIQEKYRNALYKMAQRPSSGPAVGLLPDDIPPEASPGHTSPEDTSSGDTLHRDTLPEDTLPEDTPSEDTPSEDTPSEVAAYKDATPANTPSNNPLATFPPMFGKDTLSQIAIDIDSEVNAGAGEGDLNQ